MGRFRSQTGLPYLSNWVEMVHTPDSWSSYFGANRFPKDGNPLFPQRISPDPASLIYFGLSFEKTTLSCHLPVIYRSFTGHLPVIYLSFSCHFPVIFLSFSCHFPVIYLSFTGHLPVIYRPFTGHLPVFVFPRFHRGNCKPKGNNQIPAKVPSFPNFTPTSTRSW